MNPLIRIRLAQLLARKYKLDSLAAVNLAEELDGLLKAGDLDIVKSSWVEDVGKPVQPAQRESFWDGVARRINETDETYGDWAPWRPYEKEN